MNRDEILQAAGKTAITRKTASVPARMLASRLAQLHEANGEKDVFETVFDYGCGKGKDIEYLSQHFNHADGWDPVHKPEPKPFKMKRRHGGWDFVLLTYVLNVIPKEDRSSTLHYIRSFLPKWGSALITVRTRQDIDRSRTDKWKKHEDMYVTTKGTIQRGFDVFEVMAMVLNAGFANGVVLSSSPVIVLAERELAKLPFYGWTESVCPSCFSNVRYVRHERGAAMRCHCRHINKEIY